MASGRRAAEAVVAGDAPGMNEGQFIGKFYADFFFWVNGVASVSAAPAAYWAPVISGTAVWPFLYMFLSGIRYRSHSGS